PALPGFHNSRVTVNTFGGAIDCSCAAAIPKLPTTRHPKHNTPLIFLMNSLLCRKNGKTKCKEGLRSRRKASSRISRRLVPTPFRSQAVPLYSDVGLFRKLASLPAGRGISREQFS